MPNNRNTHRNAITVDTVSEYWALALDQREIGCGSESKPILLELQGEAYDRAGLAKANRNGVGCCLGEQLKQRVTNEGCSGGFGEERDDGRGTEWRGPRYCAKEFCFSDAWYHGPDVDDLSKQEAMEIGLNRVDLHDRREDEIQS